MAQARQLTLTDEQRRDLLDCREHHPKAYMREKAAAILKVADGQAVRQVAAHGLLRPRQPKPVGRWIDRYLAEGTTLDELRQTDGTLGYSPNLRHGVTGKGLNDYDAIFRILAGVGFEGWISVEDGMNGLDELRGSVEFLKGKREEYYGSV